MTKNDIVVSIAKATGLRQVDVKKVAQMTLDGIVDALVDDGRIELRNFGIFEVKTRRGRKARNPRTGEEVMVPPKKVVTFKPGKMMEERVCREAAKLD
ncbi:MAG: integration host factor subunit beta [Planctomycetes bacterium]|nr:integration host factor subunit beta [Planctomycetota bacterium]